MKPTFWKEPTMRLEPFYESLLELSRPRTNWARYLMFVEMAHKAGDDNASYTLGTMYLRGFSEMKSWKRNAPLGLRLIHRASRSVHMAMLELAVFYENGEFGLRANPKKAFALFAKAVEYGSIAARFHLGRCYLQGMGTRVTPDKARRQFLAAAALGFDVPWDQLPITPPRRRLARKSPSA